ncbi:MAG: hypothetical protein KDJ48_16425 [Nitratireductor sp.]|nr:hypothetical protein [Nitratireductor sp.]
MKTPMKSYTPDAAAHAFRADLLDLLHKHSRDLPSDKMLAIAAYSVGQIIALQNQRTMTSDMAMDLVIANIQKGNQHALDEVANKTAGSA